MCHKSVLMVVFSYLESEFSLSPPQATVVPSSITFNWRRCNNIPLGVSVYGQPVALDGKLYIRAGTLFSSDDKVLEYTPDRDQWTELPSPPAYNFTTVILGGQLLIVGGEDKSTGQNSNTILTFNTLSKQWIQSHPAMPTALAYTAVIGYQDHLIVAGGRNSEGNRLSDVNILDTTSNKWKTAQPLPSTDDYSTLLIKDTIYLVGQKNQTVLRAHVPTLVSGAESGVWETIPNTPFYRSTPVTVCNTLLTVGGTDLPGDNPSTNIQMYSPTTNKWTKVGDLPKPVHYYCVIMNTELFVVRQSVHVSTLTLVY